MDKIPIPVESIVGAAIVALAFIGWQIVKIIFPANRKKTEDREKLLVDTIARNATAMEKLSQNVDRNTAATTAGTEAIKISQQREDLFTRMLVEVMRTSGRAPESTVAPPPSTTTTTTTK